MMVLRAFYKGLEMWEAAPDMKLPEEVWHVKDHYDNIRKKLSEVKEEDAACFNYKELNPKRICTTPMQVRARQSSKTTFALDLIFFWLLTPVVAVTVGCLSF